MFEVAAPPPELCGLVEYFWCGKNHLEKGMSFTHRAAASVRTELLFHCAGDFLTIGSNGRHSKVFAAGFYGQTDSFSDYTTHSKFSRIFGIRLFSHAVREIFGFSALELSNKNFRIDDVLGTVGAEISERIFTAELFQTQTKIAADFLRQTASYHRRKKSKITHGLTEIYLSNFQSPGELVKQNNLSARQFERVFKNTFGFSFSRFQKILRFEKSAALLETTDLSLTEIAHQCGYFDQSHFIRDFKSFGGTTPKKYLEIFK